MDEKGYYYFMDRLGDTFRWKGENVSTTEVQEVLLTYDGVLEANVYGVEVPGQDGRAGMAALVVDDGFDLGGCYAYLEGKLPRYAVPVFVRMLGGMSTTATLKLVKTGLRKEGIDPGVVGDRMFWVPEGVGREGSGRYVEFGKREFEEVVKGGGRAKL